MPGDGSLSQAQRESEPTSARPAIVVLLVLLCIFVLLAIRFTGFEAAFDLLGLSGVPLSVYTFLLISPVLFESGYHPVRPHLSGRAARVLDNLHVSAPYLIVLALVMVIMRIQNVFDLAFTRAVDLDFTPLVHRLEGDVVASLQSALRTPWMDAAMVFVYIGVYSMYYVLAAFLFAAQGNLAMVRRFTTTWVVVYAVALPFYFFFPVNEVWMTAPAAGAYGYATVDDVLGESPSTQALAHAISSVNNCFPSLHNAFAWALPFLLWRSGYRRLSSLLAPVAGLISLSTLYLGIHWVTDLVAGVLLAWIATGVAVRLEYRLRADLRLRDMRWVRGSVRAPAPPPAAPA